ncbi:MAG: M14 family metallopeptidase, partial [Kangiellaceae bacterium]|nr:M14 family metallopeptidase [Kangiellaceae bacterium]
MIKKLSISLLFALGIITTFGEVYAGSSPKLSYYLPNSEQYPVEVPTPESSLGYQVGEWHARPEQIERYFYQLAESSARVKLEVYAYSHEKRPLFLAYISSEENIKNLETIRKQHLKMTRDTNRPAIAWMGYSVHGNEASGSNASMLLAYHLAAAKDKKTLEQLNQQIIIIDPMLNPDGLARFANWANMYKSKNPNSDPNTREHNESWPNGRTNHYWFDLNRDWLLLQHPESQGRVKMFHHWKPNVLTDFHEMGTNATYFFQPGVPSRQNPLTPKENFDLTAKIAAHHAKALDDIGSLYYSKESFDDFYYGKGSTYPDINGSIGILFEQASARGHLQDSVNGEVSFPFAIKNHLTTSFSTIEATQKNRKALLSYQRNFYKKSLLDAKTNRTRAIVYSSQDKYRMVEFNKILKGHQIEYYPLANPLSLSGQSFKPNDSFIVPLRQAQSALINAIFEKRQKFLDNTFYDVSSWTLPLAFDMDYQFVDRSDFSQDLIAESTTNASKNLFESISPDTIALAFSWKNFASSHLLAFLHEKKIQVRVVSKPVSFLTSAGKQRLYRGDLIVPVKNTGRSVEELYSLLSDKLSELSVKAIEIKSGLSTIGPDIGSPSIPLLKMIRPVMIVGDGVSSYQAGEVWHLLDQRLAQDLTMMTSDDFTKAKVSDYTHLIMVGGSYSLSEKVVEKIDLWVKSGGVLITQSGASEWLSRQGWLSSKGGKLEQEPDTKISYADRDEAQSEHFIGGAIVQTSIDTTHPLGFGLSDNNLAVFKRGQFSFTEAKESFVSIARFTKKPLLAGYLSKQNQNNIAGKTAVLVQKHGDGKLIAFTDDMNFRA